MDKGFWVLLIILLLATAAGWIWAIVQFVNTRANANRIADLENAVKLGEEINRQLAENYSGLTATNNRLTESLGRADETIKQLQGIAIGAGGELSGAFETIRRLEKLSKKIGN